jgi:hypothetical protein
MIPMTVPKRVQAVIDRMGAGERLCKSLKQSDGDGSVEFRLEPSGDHVGPETARLAISCWGLKPCGDGLFDDGTSQTWVLA